MADEGTTQVGQPDAMAGAGVEPEGTGYAPPDPGQGESAESEIPVGVDALDPEKVEAAQAQADAAEDSGALDVSAIVADEGDMPEEGGATDEAGADDPTAKTDADAPVAPDTGGEA